MTIEPRLRDAIYHKIMKNSLKKYFLEKQRKLKEDREEFKYERACDPSSNYWKRYKPRDTEEAKTIERIHQRKTKIEDDPIVYSSPIKIISIPMGGKKKT